MAEKSSILFVFIDESGNFDFSPTGTKYWVLTAMTTETPMLGREPLIQLRYELLAEGLNQESFHATEDQQDVRNRVYEIIAGLSDISVHSVFVQKNKTNPVLYETYTGRGKTKKREDNLYNRVAQALLTYVFLRYGPLTHLKQVVVVLGSLFTRTKQDAINQALKESLKAHIGKPFHIYFHDGKADINSQIADYCSWAIYRSLEDGETRPLEEIETKVRTKFDMFERGTTEYYEYPEN